MSSSSSPPRDGIGDGSRRRRRRGGDYEGPSSSRSRRAANEVWPEHVVEALATQVSIDAARSLGRLAAAQALVNLFQVCSTWRAVSRSELLWIRLTHQIWHRTNLLHPTWRDEYIFRHRTASNFRTRRSSHVTLHFDPSDIEDPDGLSCRCLALSDFHLACGFADGTVRLFSVATGLHLTTFRPQRQDRLGRFSRAISGIICSNTALVFASIDGDIHHADITHVLHPHARTNARRVHHGDLVNDGALVDFSGRGRWWVGLYAGVPGCAFQIWDSNTETRIFIGGTLTDQMARVGWQMLTEVTEFVGRVRVTNQELAVACTSTRFVVFDLSDQGVVLAERDYRRGIIVSSLDVNEEPAYVWVDRRGIARVRRVGTFDVACRFNVAQDNGVMGCMNLGYALMCAGGVIRVWGIEQENGEHLYSFGERVGELNALVASDRHVAAADNDTTIHLWDFGAE